eukprot:m.38004 g.38004  ORF g.38004 m.38004 type:complete len:68 (+) comp6771_c0_seq3:1900-2103(+)
MLFYAMFCGGCIFFFFFFSPVSFRLGQVNYLFELSFIHLFPSIVVFMQRKYGRMKIRFVCANEIMQD